MAESVEVAATAQVFPTTAAKLLQSVVLTPAAAKATVVLKTGGASGTSLISLQAAADGNSVVFDCSAMGGVIFAAGIHATVAGAGALVDLITT